MIATYRCQSPDNIRIQNRQAKNRKRERDPKRRAEVKKWCEGKLCTCGCGQPANTPHHPGDNCYADEIWADLRECEPWRHTCHRRYHKGWVRCPQCGGWMKPGFEVCYKCSGGGKTHTRKKIPFRIDHPCQDHRRTGRCGTDNGFGQCQYSAKDAEGRCEEFRARKAVS